jgi:protease IV
MTTMARDSIRRLAAALTAMALLLLPGCDGRPRRAPASTAEEVGPLDPHVAEIDLRRGAPEVRSTSLLAGGRNDSFADLVKLLRTMPDEDRVKALFVRLGASQLSVSRADEIGRLLGALRDKRPVICHADGYGTGSILLAARGCSEVWLSPAGSVDTYGIAAQLMFGRKLLDRLDVQVDFIQVGRFKGAEEPFTRNDASPEARQSLQHALAGVRRAWLDGIAQGRDGVDGDRLEEGPHHAQAAKALGVIDSVGFEDEARARAYEVAGVSGEIAYFGQSPAGANGIAGLVRLLSGADAANVPHVAVVRATGAITLAGGGGLFGDRGIAERDLSKTLDELRTDPSVRAVVLRIDSPGGSALASDLLWRSLMRLREDKPLIISVGSMAASGGYYMACAGTKVLVEGTSIIGSIGVVAGKLSVDRPLAEQGIFVETVPARPGHTARPVLGSPFSAWDDATRDKLREGIEHTYDLFLSRIAEGRGLDIASVEPHAEGRLMSGADAVQAKLADEIGGLSRAIDLAAELGDLQAEATVPIRVLRDGSGLLGLLGLEQNARVEAAERLEQQASARALELLTAELIPFRDELAVFAATAQPLIGGEHIVAALPFAIAIR